MPLRLSEEDQLEYNRLSNENEFRKQTAIAVGDHREAKKARQAQSFLYNRFKAKEIPLPPMEQRGLEELTLLERVEQIERHLGLNRWGV